MTDRPIPNDVYDPTTDPRHRPPTEQPGEDANTARPRDVSTEDHQTPREEEQPIDKGVVSTKMSGESTDPTLQVRRPNRVGRKSKRASPPPQRGLN